MMTNLPEILVVGGTGAQGLPVVYALAESGRYVVRVLTRDPESKRAKEISLLSNVTLIKGQTHSQSDLHAAFKGVYGAFVNTDGFTLGEKNELFYGIRAYEIARHEKVKHYVWANSDYALRKAGWDEQFHWGHNDAKGRIGDLILAQKDTSMKSTLFTTGPYMNMLFDGMFVPVEEDGKFVWINPAGTGKIPLIALEDVGVYVLWIFDHLDESAGLDLEVATEQVSFQEIADTFTRVTGKAGVHRTISMDDYMAKAEPFPDAPVNWTAGAKAPPRDESIMTWKQNFSAWWRYWAGGIGATRDFELLDRIHPTRIKSLEEWMRKVNYQGVRQNVLKGHEDAPSQEEVEKASKLFKVR